MLPIPTQRKIREVVKNNMTQLEETLNDRLTEALQEESIKIDNEKLEYARQIFFKE